MSAHPRCPHCGRFLSYDAYYDRWTCSQDGAQKVEEPGRAR